MTTLDKLLTMALEFDISVTYKDLKKHETGMLGWADAGERVIALDKSLIRKPREQKCVLAEEIGHILYPPRPGHIAYHARGFYDTDHINQSLIKAIVAQDERKALDWATSVLMPNVEFWRAVDQGVNTVYQLAEYFDVEEWFVLIKIGYIRRKAREGGVRLKWRDIIKRVQ